MKKYFTGFASLLLSASLVACVHNETETNQKQEDQVSTSKESKSKQEERITVNKSNSSKKSNSKNIEQSEDKSHSEDEVSTVVSFAYPEKESQAEVKQVIYMSQEQPQKTYTESSDLDEIKQVIAFSEPYGTNKTITQEKQNIQEGIATSKRVLVNIDNDKTNKEKSIEAQTPNSKATIKENMPTNAQEENSSSKQTKTEYQPIFAINEPKVQTEIVADTNKGSQSLERITSQPKEQVDLVLKPFLNEKEEVKNYNSVDNDKEQIESSIENDSKESLTKANVNVNGEVEVLESFSEKKKETDLNNNPEPTRGNENTTLIREDDKESEVEKESEANTEEIVNSDNNLETAELQLMAKEQAQDDSIEKTEEEKIQESLDESEVVPEEKENEVNEIEPVMADDETQNETNEPEGQLRNELIENQSTIETVEQLEESIEDNPEDKTIHLEIEVAIKNDDQENAQVDSESRIEDFGLEEIEVEIFENKIEDSNSDDKEFLEV